jgi:hypothetical protein
VDFDKMNRLAIKLEKEKATLPDHNAFGEVNDKTIYDAAIGYLRTGKKPDSWEDNDLLAACVEDFDCLCSDYGVE